MSPDSQSIESTDGLLRIEFRWLEDRYVQHLSLRGRDVGRSLEGGSSDAWPPSPPIQQLSVESINEQPTALAVGAAGRGHWSLSGEPDPDHPSAIRFEIACRCRESADYLGSVYELDESLVLEPIDGSIEQSDSDTAEDHSVSRRITVRPNSLGTTCRWSYRIEPRPSS